MVVIAFSGCDGSGKTTLALKFKEYLESMGLKVKYRKEFEYFILKHLLKALGEKVERERKKFLGEIKSKSLLDRLKYKLWPFLVWIDSNLEIACLKFFNRNYLLILDRCIVDHLAGFEYLKYINKDIRNLLLKYSLKPDLIIVLDAPPEVMYERKKETHHYQLDFYREQRERYLDMAMRLKAPVVRTDKLLNESLEEILHRILLRFGKSEDIVLHVLSDPLGYPDIENYSRLLKDIDWNSLDLRYIIIEASRNNVEFPFYEKLYRYLSKPVIKEVLELIELYYQNFLKILALVSEIFESSGINYVVFKTIPPYKYLPRDIDILVSRRVLKKAIELLISSGFKLTKTHILHKEISLEKNGVEIDLHWQIEWMGNRVIDESSILRDYNDYKVEYVNVKVTSPTHELLLLTAHAVLQHHYITIGEVHYIRALIRNYDIDWNLVLNIARKNHFYEGLISLMLIVIAKDVLFYGAYIKKKVENIIELYLRSKFTTIPLIEISKPVIWLSFKSLPLLSILNFIDMVLAFYRKLRYSLIGSLPYNEPLKEIASFFGES